MADTQVLSTLDTKRKEIEAHIGSLERDLEQARRDLSAILAAIKVFSADGPRVTAYMNLSRLFPRHELPKLAKAAPEAAPDGVCPQPPLPPCHRGQGPRCGRPALAEGDCLQGRAGASQVGERTAGAANRQGRQRPHMATYPAFTVTRFIALAIRSALVSPFVNG